MSRKFLIPPPLPPAAIAGSQISSSLSIAAIAGIGILTTVVFLLIYYIFVIKCCLHRRRSDQLSPSLPQAESAGLDPSAIRAIPTVRFSPASAAAAVECPVCLSEFRGGEMVRLLPGCAHAFHIDCIDTWLQSRASCPLCRTHIADSDCAGSGGGGGGIVPAEEGRKLGYAVSIGDEWIEFRREGEVFGATPLRRSVSMDSSFHRRLFVSVQDVLRRNASSVGEEGGGDDGRGDGGRGRGRPRAFFQFGYWRGGRRVVQPAEDMHV